MKKLTLALAATLILLAGANAIASGKLRALSWQEASRYGATHCIEVDHADLDYQTTDATAAVFTNTVVAPYSLEFRGYLLDQAFDSDRVTNHFTCAVSVGTSSSSTKWINGLQVAYDYTPTVYASLGTDYTGTTALTSTPTIRTIEMKGTNVTANVMTNLTVATSGTVTMATPLLSAQTADLTTWVTVGSPGSGRDLAEFTRGKFRVFFRILSNTNL